MSIGLQPIPLKELKDLSVPKKWVVQDYLENLSTLTPIKGVLTVEHQEKSLLIKANLQTIVSLQCDRCLKGFNQTILFNGEELIWIGNENDLDSDIYLDELVEYIDPRGKFEPEQWIFEQLNLQMPILNICSEKCPGPNISNNIEASFRQGACNVPENLDPRWSPLKKLL